jgi:hypothetical protein
VSIAPFDTPVVPPMFHHDHARAQGAEQRHRVLQQVRHHDGDALALRHAGQALQEGGEGARLPVELGVGHRAAEVVGGRLVREPHGRLFEQIGNRAEAVGVDLRGHPLGIASEPGLVQHVRLLRRLAEGAPTRRGPL